MRTHTAQQIRTLSSKVGYSTRARVKVQRSGTWHDLTDLTGLHLDFLQEVTWGSQVDAPAATATVRCSREVNGASLAPLMVGTLVNTVAGVHSPLLQEGRRFAVEVAVLPLGRGPTDADWIEVFHGEIDEIDTAEEVSFTGRDYGMARLQDTFIKAEAEYGSALGVDVQTVMQSILNANGLAAFTLYTPVSPNWALKKYIQKGEPVADALQALARQLGWEVRWKWLSSGPGTGAWRLWFWSPDRSATVPVWTYGPGEYERLEEVRTSREDVRNDLEGVYSTSGELDEAGNKKRKTVATSSGTSIAAYGNRFARFAESATSNIDTAGEMTTFLARALADLKDVPLGVSFEVLLHPGLELGDLVRLSGNGVHFSADQTAAVQSLSHTGNAGGVKTKMVLQGKPTIGRRVWVDMEQRPGVAPASPFTGPDAPSSLSSATTAGGFRVRFTAPTLGPAAASYELHVSTTNGFTPSSATCRTASSATEFTVSDLQPGTTYYVRVVPRDAKGNRGTASGQLTLVPRYVEPRSLQPFVHVGSIIPNDSFEAANAAGSPPDTWSLPVGTWGTTAVLVASALSGASAVKFVGGQNNMLASSYVTVRPGEVYSLEVWAMRTAVTGANLASVLLEFMDANFNLITTGASATVNPVAADGWKRFYSVRSGTPPNARYMRAVLNQGSGTPDDIYWDSVRVREVRVLSEELVFPDGVNFRFLNSFADVNGYGGTYTVASVYKGADDEARLAGRVYRTAGGAPAAGTTILQGLPSGYRPVSTATFLVATDTGPGVVTVTAAGEVKYQSGGVGWLSLDGIRYAGSP
jgi:hypothetical protein